MYYVPSYAAPVTGSGRGHLLWIQRHASRMIFGFLLITGFHHTRLAMHQQWNVLFPVFSYVRYVNCCFDYVYYHNAAV